MVRTKRIGVWVNLDKRVEQNNNSLAFQIESVINVTKNFMAVQELKSLLKQNDGKGRGSDRQQIAEQPELLERKYFGGGKKNGRRPTTSHKIFETNSSFYVK